MGLRKCLTLASFVALSGCSAVPTSLPDTRKVPEKVLNKEEQQAKINAMILASKTHQGETAREIENGK